MKLRILDGQLPASWSSASVRDICSRVTSGGTPSRKRPDFYGGSIGWVKTKELLDGWLESTEETITKEGLESSSAKLLPEKTVLMAMYGATVGQLGILRKQLTCNQAACALIVNPDLAHYRYVYYQLLHARTQIVDSAVGAAQQNLSARSIKEFELPLPPLDEQRGIAATLGALDDKIDSNRRASELALYIAESSFTQRASEAPRIPLVQSATVVLGGTPSRKNQGFWGGVVPWINSGAANNDIVTAPTEYITQEGLARSSAKLMPEGASVVAITGATLGEIAYLGIETAGNQSLVGVWAENDAGVTAWLHFAIRSAVPDLLGAATGAAQQHVNKGNIEALRVAMPDRGVIDAWATQGVPLLQRAKNLQLETQSLEALRDALLPELLSGRIRVPEAAEAVASA